MFSFAARSGGMNVNESGTNYLTLIILMLWEVEDKKLRTAGELSNELSRLHGLIRARRTGHIFVQLIRARVP